MEALDRSDWQMQLDGTLNNPTDPRTQPAETYSPHLVTRPEFFGHARRFGFANIGASFTSRLPAAPDEGCHPVLKTSDLPERIFPLSASRKALRCVP
jgi:hypothetical protein